MTKAFLILLLTMLYLAKASADELTFYGIAYPNFSQKKARELVYRQLDQLQQYHIRLPVNWAEIEAKKGKYDFAKLEKQLKFANIHGLNTLLTIQVYAPEWACRNASCSKFSVTAYRQFVASLVLKFQQQFQQIQFANEWDFFGWDANIQQLISAQNGLYDVVKMLSPEIQVLLGGISSLTPASQLFCQQASFPELILSSYYLEPKGYRLSTPCLYEQQLLTQVNQVFLSARYDAVDLHLNGLCRYWPQYIQWLQQQTNKPIIIGEFSFSINETQTVSQCLKLLDQYSIKQAYYYPMFDLPGFAYQYSWFDKKLRPTKKFADYLDFFQQRSY